MAQGRRGWRLPHAPASGYYPVLTNLGDARLQAVVRQPIYAGGALKAGTVRAQAAVDAAGARYRIAEKDLELDVRGRFAEWLAADADNLGPAEGIERLSKYRTSLASRQAAGQGVSADVLKTDVRLAVEQAAEVEGEQRKDEARLVLNERMGRDPNGPLVLAPMPAPEPPGSEDAEVWEGVPEVAVAEADARSAERTWRLPLTPPSVRPHLFLTADVGFWVADTTHLHAQFWERLWAARPSAVAPARMARLGHRRGPGPHRGGGSRFEASPSSGRGGAAGRAAGVDTGPHDASIPVSPDRASLPAARRTRATRTSRWKAGTAEGRHRPSRSSIFLHGDGRGGPPERRHRTLPGRSGRCPALERAVRRAIAGLLVLATALACRARETSPAPAETAAPVSSVTARWRLWPPSV